VKLRAGVCFLVTIGSVFLFQQKAQARGDGILGWLHKLSGPGPFWGGSFHARAPLNAFEFAVSLGPVWTHTNDLLVAKTQQYRLTLALLQSVQDEEGLNLLRSQEFETLDHDPEEELARSLGELLRRVQEEDLQISPDMAESLNRASKLSRRELFPPRESASVRNGAGNPASVPPNQVQLRQEETSATWMTTRDFLVTQFEIALQTLEHGQAALEQIREQIDRKEMDGPCYSYLESDKKCSVKHWLGMELGARATTERSYQDESRDTWIWWIVAQNYYEYSPCERVSLYVGYAFNYFAGKEFENFWRGSLTIPGVQVRIGAHWLLGADMSYFFTRFSETDFGGPPVMRPSGGEWVPSFSVGYHFPKHR
jgi:hypothetical protein